MENIYCRFCAELKSRESLLNLDSDDKKCCEIELKLSFLNATYVNISHHDNIPNNICFSCCESLHTAYEFLRKVREAQDTLKLLFTEKHSLKIEKCSFSDPESGLNDVPKGCETNSALNLDKSVEVAYVQIKIEPEQKFQPEKSLQYSCEPSTQNLNILKSIDENTSEAKSPNKAKKECMVVDETASKTCDMKEKKSWNQYPWICKFCNNDYPNLDALRSHSKTEHNRCVPFTCVDCNEYKKMRGKNFTRFILHVRKHRPMLWNFCHYCDKEVTKKTLHAHLQKHFEDPSLVCLVCGEIFQNKDLCNRHTEEYFLKFKQPIPRNPAPTTEDLTCEICKKVYNSRKYLKEHIKRHDSDRNKTHVCDRCGKVYYDQSDLKAHIKAIHDKIQPYTCKICKKPFRYPSLLKQHITVHSGEKPFSCEICEKKFRLERHLANHKIVHTDSMPYSCQHCPKKFRFAEVLKLHLVQHTGAKPFSCDICLKTFTNWSNHNKHMKRRHNVETAKRKRTPQGTLLVNPENGQAVKTKIEEL